jgi:uncharacterized low-complexity protein
MDSCRAWDVCSSFFFIALLESQKYGLEKAGSSWIAHCSSFSPLPSVLHFCVASQWGSEVDGDPLWRHGEKSEEGKYGENRIWRHWEKSEEGKYGGNRILRRWEKSEEGKYGENRSESVYIEEER